MIEPARRLSGARRRLTPCPASAERSPHTSHFWSGTRARRSSGSSRDRGRLVRRIVVVRLRDPVTDPIAELAHVFRCGVVEPGGQISLVDVGGEHGFDLYFAA